MFTCEQLHRIHQAQILRTITVKGVARQVTVLEQYTSYPPINTYNHPIGARFGFV